MHDKGMVVATGVCTAIVKFAAQRSNESIDPQLPLKYGGF
jgi:hypothetical protein